MTDILMTVYIVSTIIRWDDYPAADHVFKKEPEICNELRKSSKPYGEIFCASNRELDMGLECRWIICLHSDWPDLERLHQGFEILKPAGQIIEGHECFYFANESSLTLIRNPVLIELFLYDDGASYETLEEGIDFRLKGWARSELMVFGLASKARSQIAEVFASGAWKYPPKDWKRENLLLDLNIIANSYLNKLRAQSSKWFVIESLQEVDFNNLMVHLGTSIEHVVEALVDDLSEPHQRLIRANPLIEARSLPDPEMTSIRRMQSHELFYTRRGMTWLNGEELVWLGELPGDFFGDQHGNVIVDLEEQLRRHVVDTVSDMILERDGQLHLPVDVVVQSAHDVLDSHDVLGLWIKDIELIAETVFEHAKHSDSNR